MSKRTKKLNQYHQYSSKCLDDAILAVKSGMSVRKAAAKYSVPKSTLHDYATGKVQPGATAGRPPVFAREVERRMANEAAAAASKGFGISRLQMMARAGKIADQLKLNCFKNNKGKGGPTKGWWTGFRNRNPDLSIRKPEATQTIRTRMMNPTIVGAYFSDLKKIIASDFKDKPHLIWNVDEKGFRLEHQPVHVIARKGTKSVPGRVGNLRTNVSLLACINAAGNPDNMPPMLVVRGKTKKCLEAYNIKEAPKDTVWAFQEKANMEETLGAEWFTRVFLKNCGRERPQLLILDSHRSHESLELVQQAADNNIILLALPPHTTHYLQPLDRCIFGPLSTAYRSACSVHMNSSPDNTVSKWTFPKLFKEAYDKAMTNTNIQSGFRACAIHPLDPSVIPLSAYLPSSPSEIESIPVPISPAVPVASADTELTKPAELPSSTVTSDSSEMPIVTLG